MLEQIASSSLTRIVYENTCPSQKEWTRKKVMGVALIVFGVIAVCAFTACAAAAVALGSSALGVGAGVIGLIGIGVLITALALNRDKPEPAQKPVQTLVTIVPAPNEQLHRPSVPQLFKRPSSSAVKTRK